MKSIYCDPPGSNGNTFSVGRFTDLSDPDYRLIPAISKSSLDWFDVSPAHFKHVIIDGNKPDATPAMEVGSAFDCLLLTPELFKETYAIAPNTRRGTKAWDEFEAQNAGKKIIKLDDYDRLSRMRDSVMSHSMAKSILSNGAAQVSFCWTDPLTGINCKSRADYQRKDSILVDVKTTGEGGAKAEIFQRTAFNMRYHVQAAFYSDGTIFSSVYPEAFLFVVVERDPPYPVAVYAADKDFISLGQIEYRKNLARLLSCLNSDTWQGYPEDILSLSLPAFAKL